MTVDGATLARLNPWWDDPRGFQNDASLRRLKASPFVFDRTGEVAFSDAADAIFTLRGPRQAGKTTLLKEFMAQRDRAGVDPKRLLYLSCDLETRDGLARTLADWLGATGSSGARRLVVLDEVSDVPGWPTALRALWNQGLLRNVTIIASGSHALDLRHATETLPGRRGEARRAKAAPPLDQVLLSAPFRSFARATLRGAAARRALLACPAFSPADLAASAAAARWVRRLSPVQGELAAAFDQYLLCGGFPIPAHALAARGEIPPEIFRLHAASAGADLSRFSLSERSAAQIARRITEVITTPVSWTTLVAGTDVRTHVTGKVYVEAFAAAFLVHEIPPIDLGTKQPVWQRERKVYPSDPFVLHSLRAWGLGLEEPFTAAREYAGNPASRGRLLECAVASALARGAPPGLLTGVEVSRRLTYLRTRGGREVDFVVRGPSARTPVEVKSSGNGHLDRKAMSLVGRGVIVTDGETDVGASPRMIAAPLFMTLLGAGP
jgi:uncharacterized protein